MEMGIEFSAYLRYVAALIFVLALIWVASQILKRSMGHRFGIKRASQAALRIIEVLPIDSRHKMVLVKHHEREHLLLLGNEHALLVTADAATSDNAITNKTQSSALSHPSLEDSVQTSAKSTVKKEPTL